MLTRSLLCATVTLFDHGFQYAEFPFSIPWRHQRWYSSSCTFPVNIQLLLYLPECFNNAVLQKMQSKRHSVTPWAAAAAQWQLRDRAQSRNAGGCLRWDNCKTQAGVKSHENGHSSLLVQIFSSPVCSSYTCIRVHDLTPLRNQMRVPHHWAQTPTCPMLLWQLVPGSREHWPHSLPDGMGTALDGTQLESLNFNEFNSLFTCGIMQ